MTDSDRRILSDRYARAERLIDRPRPRNLSTPTFAGQVYNGGSMGSTVPLWYLTHPVEFSGGDSEGAGFTPSADTSRSIPVIVLNKAPSAGDILIAEMVGGKWVAELAGSSTKICVHVTCSPTSFPVVGATIQLFNGATLVASCTTNSSGCCTFSQTGTFTVQVIVSGSVAFSGSKTLSGADIGILLSAGSAQVICCGGYAIPTTLTLTDALGSTAFVYDPSFTSPLWTGGHSATLLSCTVTTPNNTCIVANPTTGPVRVCYQMICHAGQNPTFTVQRSWSWVYKQGTLTAIWYQDPSGFAPGQFCITAPPAACGNPLTDTASFGANPSSTAPFALSGTPVAAGSNATADPVGGTVAISA